MVRPTAFESPDLLCNRKGFERRDCRLVGFSTHAALFLVPLHLLDIAHLHYVTADADREATALVIGHDRLSVSSLTHPSVSLQSFPPATHRREGS
jgi:hypothetical protein